MDNHYGELTVRETFDFSARCQGAGYKPAQLAELAAREAERGIAPDPEVVRGAGRVGGWGAGQLGRALGCACPAAGLAHVSLPTLLCPCPQHAYMAATAYAAKGITC